ncbi:hypothetical protein [Actinomadura sp. NPDC000929]|uniref:hypothetical protein n=1 Tax=Actinomadura sp. NPDC000929 TaxID=3154517 RepID=UPI00339699C8
MADGQDALMSGSRRMLTAVLVVAAGVVLAGAGVFFTLVGLDDADRWASVMSVFLTALGLGVSVYGMVLTRRGLGQQPQAAGQRVGGDVQGPNLQIGQAGDVRVGPAATRPRRSRHGVRGRARFGGQTLAGGQEVHGSVGGRNVQIGQADDVDVD